LDDRLAGGQGNGQDLAAQGFIGTRRRDGKEHADPADRLIVETAMRHQLEIIGDDEEMRRISATHAFTMIW
jgi:PIN domain nuclease of toxin-antitoxin system